MALSEERKRQIRAEEEAAFRADQEAEQQYREEVRRELEEREHTESERQYREQVRVELADTPPAQTPASPIARQATGVAESRTAAASPPRRSSPWARRMVAGVFVLGGLVCIGLAFGRGFSLPFIGGGREITLRAETSGEAEPLGEAVAEEWEAPETPTPGEDASAGGRAPAPSSPPASTAPKTAQTPERPAAPAHKRASLRGAGISVEVPSDWRVESGGSGDALEIRWRGTGVASGHEEVVAYLLLQDSDLRRGESLDDFGERMVEEFMASTTPDQRVTLEGDDEIASFHGVPALSIDIISRGYLPYRMRNLYWIRGGKGYILSCYATAGSFEDRAADFDRTLKSIRFSSGGR